MILFESTHRTPTEEDALAGVLNNLRQQRFPRSFEPRLEENKLIKRMISHRPGDRPEIGTVLKQVELLLSDEHQGKLSLRNTTY